MGRSIAAVVVGLMAGLVVMALLQWAGMQIYPEPPGRDSQDAEVMAAALESQPVGAFFMVLMAWFFGTVDAAILAAWLAPDKPWRHVAVVSGFLFALVLLYLASVPSPSWFVLVALLIILVAVLLGGKIGSMLFDRRQIGLTR